MSTLRVTLAEGETQLLEALARAPLATLPLVGQDQSAAKNLCEIGFARVTADHLILSTDGRDAWEKAVSEQFPSKVYRQIVTAEIVWTEDGHFRDWPGAIRDAIQNADGWPGWAGQVTASEIEELTP